MSNPIQIPLPPNPLEERINQLTSAFETHVDSQKRIRDLVWKNFDLEQRCDDLRRRLEIRTRIDTLRATIERAQAELEAIEAKEERLQVIDAKELLASSKDGKLARQILRENTIPPEIQKHGRHAYDANF